MHVFPEKNLRKKNSQRGGGVFRENKKPFCENTLYMAKIPTKSIFNSKKR